MITIEPLFGLCNRMRAVGSALALARKLDRPLRIVWILNQDLNCRFEDLFEIPDGVTDIVQPKRKGPKRYSGPLIRFGFPEASRWSEMDPTASKGRNDSARSWVRSISAAVPRIFHRINRMLAVHPSDRVLYEADVVRLYKEKWDFERLAQYGTIYLQTYLPFYQRDTSLSVFQPIPEIQERIDRETARFGDETIGVHIRRTDHVRSIANSTTEKFIALLASAVEENPKVRFFLATDSPEEETRLKTVFPGRVQTYSKRSFDRNSKEGIQDAVVDLYCLAGTRKIIGSFQSSFSGSASRIGGIEFIQVV